MRIIRRLLDRLFRPARMGWANAHRISADHAYDVARIEREADAIVHQTPF